MRIVLFSTDLMLYSSVSGAASASGHEFQSGTDIDGLTTVLQEPDTLLCLDLNTANGDPAVLASMMRPEVLARSVAFGPHVHVEKLNAAKAAGFGTVMPRGQFVSQLMAILNR